MFIRFRPGAANPDDRPQSLHVYLTVNGTELSGYTSGVQVRPSPCSSKPFGSGMLMSHKIRKGCSAVVCS